MGTRYKPLGSGKVESMEAVNAALQEIKDAEAELTLIDAACDAQVSKLKEKAAKDGEGYRDKIAQLIAKIQAFAEYNKEELFAKAKSVEVENGTFGYRQSTKVGVKKVTLELLHKLIENRTVSMNAESDRAEKARLKEEIAKLEVCIKVEEKLSKTAIGELSDTDRCAIQATKTTADQVFCETRQEEPNQNLLKQAV